MLDLQELDSTTVLLCNLNIIIIDVRYIQDLEYYTTVINLNIIIIDVR